MATRTTAPVGLDAHDRDAARTTAFGTTTAGEHRVLIPTKGPVVALRRRSVVVLGGLADRMTVAGNRFVAAHDLDDTPWWVPAEAIWSDAVDSERPGSPRGIGLATANTRERALLAGLSDRLGWEALAEFERSRNLSVVDTSAFRMSVRAEGVAILDGRLARDIPTVVVIGEDLLRWGAGATWEAAIQRAMYRHASTMDPAEELAVLSDRLDAEGLGVVSVDLGSNLLRAAGVHRVSVQLLSH